MKSQKNNARFLWLALYAAAILFTGGRMQLPIAAWLAPVFGLHFYRHSEKGGRAFLWLWLATAVPTAIAWHNSTAISALAGPIAEPIFFAIVTPITLLAVVIDRIYYRRWSVNGKSPFWITLVFPVAASALDFFSGSGSPLGTFGAAAYTQAGFTSLMQMAAVAGMWSIPFIVNWFGSVVNYAWEHSFEWPQIKRGVATFASILLIIFGFGFGRIAFAEAADQEVAIAGFSLPEGGFTAIISFVREGDSAGFEAAAAALHAEELAQIRTLAQDGAQIVVLQEGAGLGYSAQVDELLANAADIAREEGIYIVLPTAAFDKAGEAPMRNIVNIIDPSGEIVLEHFKYGGTQFEGSVAGSGELQTIDTPYGKLSAVICWDADFPATMLQAGKQDVDILFVPSEDWRELRDIHAGMATFRAVESGVSIFRQTGDGVSLATDSYGNILNRVDLFETESASQWGNEQMVDTPINSVNTIYTQIGDIFGLLMMISFVGLIGFALLKRKKQ